MQAPKIPADESERLRALRGLELLDTPSSKAFDCVTQLVARALRVPIVLISLVDDKRQWFKSRVGLSAEQTAREISFCGHTIYERSPLIVSNALLDERFASNPLVIGYPYIRAYAAIPLCPDRHQPVGTICVIDTAERSFSDAELLDLGQFASVSEELMRAHRFTNR